MKRYLITGASRGIGRAIATKLAAPDVTLLLHGRDRAALKESCKLVEDNKGHATPLVYDLALTHSVQKMIEELGVERLDALINNAGIAVVKPLDQITIADWEKILAVNVTAPFLLIQRLVAQMAAGSTIVNILSVAAKTGFPGWSAYCMSKFALEGFSQAVREELRPLGIRVLNIYPAATNTDIWNDVEGEWPRENMMLPSEIADAVAYALSRPAGVALEQIDVRNVSGQL